MIDSHCHLNFKAYDELRASIVERFIEAGGKGILDIATNREEFPQSQQLVQEHPNLIWGAAGAHPAYLNPASHEALPSLMSDPEGYWASFKKEILAGEVVAIGETGIDRSDWETVTTVQQAKLLDQQKWLLAEHVRLANQQSQPLIIHSREASIDPSLRQSLADIFAVLKKEQYTGPVVFHSFVYDQVAWRQMHDFDYYLGVNGVITYSQTNHIRDVVKQVPLERILLETDGPFLLPANVQPSERLAPRLNEPQFVRYVAKTLSKIRQQPAEQILEQTTANFLTLVKKS